MTWCSSVQRWKCLPKTWQQSQVAPSTLCRCSQHGQVCLRETQTQGRQNSRKATVPPHRLNQIRYADGVENQGVTITHVHVKPPALPGTILAKNGFAYHHTTQPPQTDRWKPSCSVMGLCRTPCSNSMYRMI